MMQIRKLLARDQEALAETFSQQEEGRFEVYYIEHLREIRLMFVALETDEDGNREYFAYISLLWEAPSTALWQRNIPEIVDLYVRKDARRQGIATALLQTVEKAAKEKGQTKIGISVSKSEDFAPARNLYEKLAFTLLSQSKTEMQLVKDL